MRAIVKSRAERGASFVTDHPEPKVGGRDVLVEVGAASVCGSDRELFEWTPSAQAFHLHLPVVLGHEFAGTVLEVGPEVSTRKVGDRVACETHIPCGHCFLCRNGNAHNCMNLRIVGMHIDGAFSERIAVPEHVCFPLPESIPVEIGALLEPAGVAWHAMQRSDKLAAGNTVLITGCGPIGLFVMQFAKLLGAVDIVAIEPNPFRQDLARSLGAEVFDPTEEVVEYVRSRFPERGGVDIGFETSAAPGAVSVLLGAVRPEGDVVTVGHPGQPVAIDIAASINKKGIRLSGVFGRRIWDTWQDVVRLVEQGKIDLSWMITHRVPLGDLEPILDLLRSNANKVVVLPQSPG